MLNLELYAKQLNGEVNVQEISKHIKEQQSKPTQELISLDIYLYLTKRGFPTIYSEACKKRKKPCNVKITIDKNSRELINAEFIHN